MSRTLTRYVNFQTLRGRGKNATTIVKLMMACNDLSLANQALDDWKKQQPKTKKVRQIGAQRYFVRIQLSHLYEGLKVIKEIRNDTALRALVSQCDARTQLSFSELEQFLPRGASHAEFRRLIGQVRDNLTFHYCQCETLVARAIEDRAGCQEAQTSSVTRGNTAYLWHFKAADDIVDSIVVRQIWAVPKGADSRAETDKILDRVHQIFLWFVDFSGEFIWKYCEK